MLRIREISSIFCVGFLLCFSAVSAQTQRNSPYSRFGLGEIGTRSASANRAMGGTSFAFQSATVVNFANPASYVAYDSLACLFDVAFSYENHTLTAASVQKGSSISFDYLAFGLPVLRWWKTSFGFQPFSGMSYKISQKKELNADTILTSFYGEGGINEIYWGNAFKLFKNFSVGFNASYLFGEYRKNRTVEPSDKLSWVSLTSNANFVKGFHLMTGLQYFIPVKEKGKFGLGLVYTPAIPISSKFQNMTISQYMDTLDILYKTDNQKIKHSMPQSIGGGISWGKGLHYFIGADFSWTNWGSYAVNGINDSLVNSYRMSLGGNYTPNPTGAKFISHITLSLGGSYEQTYLCLNDVPLNKWGVNFGVQFPVKRSKTTFGAIFEYGQMGTTQANLIKEDYFKVTVSVRMHEAWYQRRRLE